MKLIGKNRFKNIKVSNSLLALLITIIILSVIWYVSKGTNFDIGLGLKNTNDISLNSTDKNKFEFAAPSNSLTIEAVVNKVSPSVVSVLTSARTENIFGQSLERSGAGSGVILSEDGYILTNKHVIDGASKIAIVTAKGEVYENVKLLITDPLNDLAFLKIDGANNLSTIEVGDSKTVNVGQPVLAIGNALGEYQNSVTSGIISGISRDITAQRVGLQAESLNDLIQTDAAINSGNSGGPLVNAGGQLIGINTAVAQGANGIGFAIPIGAAKGLIKQLGQADIAKAFLGVNYVSLTPALAKYYKIPQVRGALVDQENGIVADSPANKAGLKNGDIITKINDAIVGKSGGVSTLVSEFQPGAKVLVTVERNGETLSLQVTLEAYQSKD